MALTPVLRVEWLDTDREHPTGALTHATAALNLDLNEEVRVLWDLSFHDSEEGTKNWKYSIVRFDPDYVTGLVQLQLSL
jgi:hypothetical protein